METVQGLIDRVIYQRDGFMIAKLSNGMTVLGDMQTPSTVVEYEFDGEWKQNAKYGKQFQFQTYKSLEPKDPTAVAAYIREHCKWVGVQTARAIADTYKAEALSVCKMDPSRVADDIRGITLERAHEIAKTLNAIAADEALQIELKELFLNIPVQKRALKQIAELWGPDAPAMIRKDPYVLPDVITGVGFATADIVGQQKLKISTTDPRRVRGAVMHAMRESVNGEGHTCLPSEELFNRVFALTSCKDQDIRDMVDLCVDNGQLVRDKPIKAGIGTRLYLPNMWEDEQYCIKKLLALASIEQKPVTPVLDGLADDQAAAVRKCLASSVSILTGPAGSGKSFAIKRVIDSLASSPTYSENEVMLAAPTGKAAKRMFEHTNYPSQTIHKLLEPEQVKSKSGNAEMSFVFSRNEDDPLECKTLILDETSMLDLPLFASTLRAIPPKARLILIGDVNQLPAVGAGNVLHDLIKSGTIPVAELTKIKRQNPGLLLRNAHEVKDGKPITVENENPNGDFYFLASSSQMDIQTEISDLVLKRLPTKYGYDPLRDIQVISPFREKTQLSCKALNAKLQDALNRDGEPVGKSIFRVGDKVIQRRNDYERKIVNGDIGIVLDWFKASNDVQAMNIRFDNPEREVGIPVYDNDLQLAYCLTCHSFQGSEAPAVIIPIHTSFGSLIMQRSWVYTAITRAKSLCIVIGEMSAFREASKRNRQVARFTSLAEKLAKAAR